MTCSKVLKLQGKPYPRTCPIHGLGPCPEPDPEPAPISKPVTSINFEYCEESKKWVVKANNMKDEDEARQAFMAILITCQQIVPEHQIHSDVNPTDTPNCFVVRPALLCNLRDLN